MANLYITAEYKASTKYILGWNIELPNDYTSDDVKEVKIKYSQDLWILMKDDTEHFIHQNGDTLEQYDDDSEGWKWSDNEQWSATGEHYNV